MADDSAAAGLLHALISSANDPSSLLLSVKALRLHCTGKDGSAAAHALVAAGALPHLTTALALHASHTALCTELCAATAILLRCLSRASPPAQRAAAAQALATSVAALERAAAAATGDAAPATEDAAAAAAAAATQLCSKAADVVRWAVHLCEQGAGAAPVLPALVRALGSLALGGRPLGCAAADAAQALEFMLRSGDAACPARCAAAGAGACAALARLMQAHTELAGQPAVNAMRHLAEGSQERADACAQALLHVLAPHTQEAADAAAAAAAAARFVATGSCVLCLFPAAASGGVGSSAATLVSAGAVPLLLRALTVHAPTAPACEVACGLLEALCTRLEGRLGSAEGAAQGAAAAAAAPTSSAAAMAALVGALARHGRDTYRLRGYCVRGIGSLAQGAVAVGGVEGEGVLRAALDAGAVAQMLWVMCAQPLPLSNAQRTAAAAAAAEAEEARSGGLRYPQRGLPDAGEREAAGRVVWEACRRVLVALGGQGVGGGGGAEAVAQGLAAASAAHPEDYRLEGLLGGLVQRQGGGGQGPQQQG